MKTFICLSCGKEKRFHYSKQNIYCSNFCQGAYTFKFKTIPRFLNGEIKDRSTIRKCLTETVGYFCVVCKLTDWNGKPITLQVDHIDGNAGNNDPQNLRLICPNCHSQTKTFGGRNKGNGRKARGLDLK